MEFNKLIEPNRILQKFIKDPIIAWAEINDKGLNTKRSLKTWLLNFIPAVKFVETATVSIFVLTENHLHYLNIGNDNKLYKSTSYNRSEIESCEIIKEKNEWQKVVAIEYEGKIKKYELFTYPSMFKYHFGLKPDDADAEDFTNMTHYMLEQL